MPESQAPDEAHYKEPAPKNGSVTPSTKHNDKAPNRRVRDAGKHDEPWGKRRWKLTSTFTQRMIQSKEFCGRRSVKDISPTPPPPMSQGKKDQAYLLEGILDDAGAVSDPFKARHRTMKVPKTKIRIITTLRKSNQMGI